MQTSFSEYEYASKKRQTRRDRFLAEIEAMTPWGELVAAIERHYDCSRGRAVPLRLLQGWSGSLMTDGYEGYNAVVAAQNIRHLACWAHVRRRSVDAAKLQPKGKKGLADEAIAMIGGKRSTNPTLEREAVM